MRRPDRPRVGRRPHAAIPWPGHPGDVGRGRFPHDDVHPRKSSTNSAPQPRPANAQKQMLARDRYLTRLAKGDVPPEWQSRDDGLPVALDRASFWATTLRLADQALQQSIEDQ